MGRVVYALCCWTKARLAVAIVYANQRGTVRRATRRLARRGRRSVRRVRARIEPQQLGLAQRIVFITKDGACVLVQLVEKVLVVFEALGNRPGAL